VTLMLRYAAATDIGMLRDNNEDSVYAGPRLLAIADGMGGHAAGEVASRVVVSILSTLDDDAVGGDLVDSLRDVTAQANEHLRLMVDGDPELGGMGTTLTAVLFAGNRVGLVHVGDSRAYLLRGDEFNQITHDDTFVQSLVDEGRITADEASTHPQRSLILRVLTGDDIEPHLSVREAVVGDRYLLCSDGLSDVVSKETIGQALELDDPQAAADRLVELALRSGGPDNISCIVADIVDGTLGPDEPVIAGAVAEHQRQRPPSADSAAGRAALARPVQPQPPADRTSDTEPPRRPVRWVLSALLLLLVLSFGSWGGWRYVQAQYYVGATDDGSVAIFHGVTGGVAGIDLHKVGRRTDMRLNDLQPAARGQVKSGITATSLRDADQILGRLADKQLPTCSPQPAAASASPASTPTPAAVGTPTPAPDGSSLPPSEPAPSMRPSTPPMTGPSVSAPSSPPSGAPSNASAGRRPGTSTTRAAGAASASPTPTATSTPTPSPTPTPSASPSAAPSTGRPEVPGEDCRKPRS